MERRRFLAATTGAVALGLAGCLGQDAGGDGDSMDDEMTTTEGGMDDDGMSEGDSMDGNESMDDGMDDDSMDDESMDDDDSMDDGSMDGDSALHTHAGTMGLAEQPSLGPDPFEAEAVIVAFEDPSCPNCRRFETSAFPQIQSEWTETGRASFVFRGFPVVYPWGKPACQALEAVYAHDEDAFWALKDYYFDEQSTFDTDNVLSKTEMFLGDQTGLDAEMVVAEAREKAYDDAVQTDLTAGRDAGFGATPSFLLFKDGAFVTELTGPKSFTVFENALQL